MILTPEIQAMVQHHLVSGGYRSPQSVLTKALYALQELEAMRAQDKENAKASPAIREKSSEHPEEASPLVQWLHDTAKPRMGLKELRRRLSKKITGTMAETVREGRDDRV